MTKESSLFGRDARLRDGFAGIRAACKDLVRPHCGWLPDASDRITRQRGKQAAFSRNLRVDHETSLPAHAGRTEQYQCSRPRVCIGDAASYFAGHGFTNPRFLRGGIDASSQEVDAKAPRYKLEKTQSILLILSRVRAGQRPVIPQSSPTGWISKRSARSRNLTGRNASRRRDMAPDRSNKCPACPLNFERLQ
jgi:hypothetical protein